MWYRKVSAHLEEEQRAFRSHYRTRRELGRMKTDFVVPRDGARNVLVGSVGEATGMVQYMLSITGKK